jgi:GMP synthase (glutamine-hydrolysing)
MQPRVLVLETMPPTEPFGAGSSGTGWLRSLLPEASLEPVTAYDGCTPLPDGRGYDAVIVPGSVSAVYERKPWMLRLEAHLRGLHAAGVPLLGICFGHQILASALGGETVRNPLGREMGLCEVRLTEAGRAHRFLFEGLGDQFRAVQAHFDVVSRPPPGSVVLAESDYGVQSFEIDTCLGIQFHPEIHPSVLAEIALHDPNQLRVMVAEGADVEALVAEWRVTPPTEATLVVQNFVSAACRQRGAAA